ncbi:OmpA family protein [Sphingobacterium griseoflavum]|uniref:Cell envelope biogenesis protein OmpA n=1 Tax=Sphingobacterium griseoflavum TaxID=1474952 RepID=A0ABQ3HWN9_9SPHI|nr:OmpA family protein [Sphingobacterium griseoflavum]GHE39238.1 cell envelope biogenesis protein OmpA [Sphingobacterium griseoflavum]
MQFTLLINTIAIMLIALCPAFGQEQLTLRDKAEECYERMEYAAAIPLYEYLLQVKKPHVKDMERLASAFLYINDYEQAENWYARAVQTPRHRPEALWGYVQALRQNGKYTEAKVQLLDYQRQYGDSPRVQLAIQGCDSAIRWIASPTAHRLHNLREVNSALAEFAPFPLKDKLYYVGEPRSSGKSRSGMSGQSYLRLFTANRAGHELSFAEPFDVTFNDARYHIGPLAASEQGDTLYVTRTAVGKHTERYRKDGRRFRKHNLELKLYVRQGEQWREEDFPYNKVEAYSVGHACLAADGQTLYFASDRPGGMGGVDIWYCIRDAKGAWGRPVNAGSMVNSPGDELFPNIFADALYYASDGFAGMGGFDIFVAQGSRGEYRTRQNLRYPINTAGDDFGMAPLLVDDDAFEGFLSSNRRGGLGSDDLYTVKLHQPSRQITLEGRAHDRKTRDGLGETMVTLFDDQGELLARKQTDEYGFFRFALQPGQTHWVFADHKGYMADSTRLAPMDNLRDTSVHVALYLAPLNKVGDKIVLENLYYDFDKHDIRPDAALVLNQVVRVMRDNPGLRIELSSHTDSRGSDDYNMKLSQRRAQAAVDYVVGRGIAADRLQARGYGESRLVNLCTEIANCSEAEHQANRRTELEVIQ